MIRPIISMGITVAIFAVITLVAALSSGSAQPTSANQALITRSILISNGPVSDVEGEQDTLSLLTRVSSLEELKTEVTAEVNLIVIDQTALMDVKNPEGAQVLYQQLREGKSLMGLNIPLSELREISQFDRAVEEIKIDPAKGPRLAGAPPIPDKPFYSFVRTSAAGSSISRFGQGQKTFSQNLFKIDLDRHALGVYQNIRTR